MRPISRAGKTEAGVTLIETLAMLGVMALGAMILAPGIELLTSSRRLGPLAVDVASMLTAVRSSAIASNGETAAIIEPRKGLISAGSRHLEMPHGVRLAVLASDSCRAAGTGVAVTFSPSGSSCGAVLELSQGSQGFKIRINWFTGHVTIQAS